MYNDTLTSFDFWVDYHWLTPFIFLLCVYSLLSSVLLGGEQKKNLFPIYHVACDGFFHDMHSSQATTVTHS